MLKFHPTPLAFGGVVLVPLREASRFYLVRIDPETLEMTKLSGGFPYMRLLRVVGNEVEFSTWRDDREIRTVSLG